MRKNNIGIYRIYNIIDGKCYIGSSILLDYRKRNHFSLLKRGEHPNIYLQSSFNKHGFTYFKWEILEFVKNSKKLVSKEDYWINKFNSRNRKCGYNFRSAFRYNDGYVGTGKIIKGEKNHRARKYHIIDIISGKVYVGKCIAEFGRKMNLDVASFFAILYNRSNIWNGRFVTPISLRRMKFFCFENKLTGRIIKHFSLIEIEKKIGLNAQAMSKLYCGIKREYKGWKVCKRKMLEFIKL